jgi:DNA polymerase I-like protein with 3'-5' exonuclease and polymerase domains
VDEEVLATLEYPEAKVLSEYFLLEKRIGQLSEGSQGWLKTERNGYLHGSINTNGAVTGRCTHSKPNLAQVPAVRSPYGKECRSLYRVQPGFRMVGADLSGLELRALAHFMHRWDSGEYGDVVLNGDVHTMNQKAADLPTRDNAKTFIYGFLYGAGDEKIGSIIGKGRDAGKAIKQKFLKGLPALKKLKDAVGEASKRGYLKGIDGRHLHVRSAHSALNLLLQSAGALASKRWLIECIHEANRRGLKYGWDGDYTLLGYIHDELQWAVREDLAEEFGKFVVECARRAGDYFNFKCPLDAEYKIGSNWYETH